MPSIPRHALCCISLPVSHLQSPRYTRREQFPPQQGRDVKDFTDEDDDHGEKEDHEEDDEFPRIARSFWTHSLYRSTVDITRTCAHVTNTAAVAVFLNRQNYSTNNH